MTTDHDLSGQMLCGRYLVRTRLGEGAMGTVYLAEDCQLRRDVALKILRKEWVRRPDIQRRLENECRILAKLGGHPNIVTLFDRALDNENVIIVMEYVEGETLSQILRRTRDANNPARAGDETMPSVASNIIPQLKAKEALLIAIQCLDALEYAHSKGVIHRDIKPANILITRDHTGKVCAKVMDFGIGKAFIEAGENTEFPVLTREGEPGPGTPAYMAPEQIDPTRFGAVGTAADLYALGVTLYEMVTLSVPFGGTLTELLHKQTNVLPPDPREYNPEISIALQGVLLKALKKRQEERYTTAAQFRSDLVDIEYGKTPVVNQEPANKQSDPQGTGSQPSAQPGPALTPIPPMPQRPSQGAKKTNILLPILGLLVLFFLLITVAGLGLYYGLTQFLNKPATTTGTETNTETPPDTPTTTIPTDPSQLELALKTATPSSADEILIEVRAPQGPLAQLDKSALSMTGSLATAATFVLEQEDDHMLARIRPNDPNSDGTIGIAPTKALEAGDNNWPLCALDNGRPSAIIAKVDKSEKTNADSVTFSVDFSEPVARFAPEDVRLMGDLGLASKVSVSTRSEGRSYDVTVMPNDPTADGTLEINLGTSIVDLAGNQIANVAADGPYIIENPMSEVDKAYDEMAAARKAAQDRFAVEKAVPNDNADYFNALELLVDGDDAKERGDKAGALQKYTEAKAMFEKAVPGGPEMKPAEAEKPKTPKESAEVKAARKSAQDARTDVPTRFDPAVNDYRRNENYQRGLVLVEQAEEAAKKGENAKAVTLFGSATEEFGKARPGEIVIN